MRFRDAAVTADEWISTLRHSQLPSVITEGRDDIIVYRRLEDYCEPHHLSVEGVGGRDILLEIFERRDELPSDLKIVFIADLDCWAIKGVPSKYRSENIIFTKGYSIENDIYCDGDLEGLMLSSEASVFRLELEKFVRWYALAFARFLADGSMPYAAHPNEIIDNAERYEYMLALALDEQYPDQLYNKFMENYRELVRGKSLFGLLMRQLSKRERIVKHSYKSLFEMVATKRGYLLNAIFDRVRSILSV